MPHTTAAGTRSGPAATMSLLSDLAAGALDPGYPIAAARRRAAATPAATGGRPRLRVRGIRVTAPLLVAAGLLLGTAALQNHRNAPGLARQDSELRDRVLAAQRETTDLAATRTRLQHRAAAARTEQTTDAAALARARTSVAGLQIPSAGSAVRGPGVLLRLVDPPGTAHDLTDVQLARAANALWAAGAEAVAVDGERLGSRTAIRTAGSAVLVGFRPVMSPYRLTAVGDADRLTARLAQSPVLAALRSRAATWGGSVRVTLADRLDLPAARDAS